MATPAWTGTIEGRAMLLARWSRDADTGAVYACVSLVAPSSDPSADREALRSLLATLGIAEGK